MCSIDQKRICLRRMYGAGDAALCATHQTLCAVALCSACGFSVNSAVLLLGAAALQSLAGFQNLAQALYQAIDTVCTLMVLSGAGDAALCATDQAPCAITVCSACGLGVNGAVLLLGAAALPSPAGFSQPCTGPNTAQGTLACM